MNQLYPLCLSPRDVPAGPRIRNVGMDTDGPEQHPSLSPTVAVMLSQLTIPACHLPTEH